MIGDRTGEQVKLAIGSAYPEERAYDGNPGATL